MNIRQLIATLSLALAMAACVVEPADEGPAALDSRAVEASEEVFRNLDVHELYRWYVSQGIDPCDPPPDPWHPFVMQGYCTADITPH